MIHSRKSKRQLYYFFHCLYVDYNSVKASMLDSTTVVAGSTKHGPDQKNAIFLVDER